MLELNDLGPIMSIFILMGIAGVASFGITEVAKRFYKSYLSHTPAADCEAWWWSPLLRVVALLIGAGAGWLLMNNIIGIGLGIAAGTLNTTMVAVVKSKLKKIAPEDE